MTGPQPTTDKPPFVARMVEEQSQLAARLTALDQFIHYGEQFVSLPTLQQRLMHEQKDAMTQYLQTLSARIALS